MKIKNKFDMLSAMSDINEEYIIKADRLLAQHCTGEAAVKMEITPMKFSWRSIAAAAACLVILIGVTFGIKAFMNKQVDALTPAQQAYLDEWKDRIGANVNVAYAVDRLTFIEIELTEDVNTKFFADENRAVFIRDGYKDDKPYKTLEIYNIKEKTYTVAAELDTEKSWSIYHAEQGYVLYHCCKEDSGTDESLYLYDANTAQNALIYKEETNILDFPWDGGKTIADGKVYFTAGDRVTGTPSLYIYDIERSGLEVIENANSPGKYKDDIVYVDSSEDDCCIRSVSGNYIFKGAPIITNHGLYLLEYGIGRFTKVESGMEIISAGKSKGIINLDDHCDFALQFGGYTLNSTAASENALGFIYYTPTDEIIVFQKDDGFGPLTFFGWGAMISKRESDGTVRTFIVTDKESENAVKIPKLEVKSDPYLKEMKYIFGAQGSVDYARDKLDIVEYDISDLESAPVLIDKNRAVITGKDFTGFPELMIYDLGSGKETMLYGYKNDREINSETEIEVKYTNKDYVVFDITFYQGETVKKHELRVVGINSQKSYTAYTMYGSDSVHRIMVIVDGTLYFYGRNGNSNANTIYSYKIGSEEQAVPVAQGSNLMAYNGNVYYNETGGPPEGTSESPLIDTIYIYTRVLDGEMPVDTQKYTGGLLVGKTGIFHNGRQTITDCVNDKALLSFNTSGYLFAKLYDSMLMVVVENNKTYQDRKAIYNTKTDELLVVAKDDDFYYDLWDYKEFDGGMYYVLENDGVYSKLCVITEKGAQSEPTSPMVERNYVSNVPEAKLSDLIDIRSENFSLPEKINGCSYWSPHFVDRTRLLTVLKNENYESIEYGIYDYKSGKYLTLLDQRDNPEYNIVYGQQGRYVYCSGKNSMWVVADIESDPDISKAKVFEVGKGVYHCKDWWYHSESIALGADGKLYFSGAVREPVYNEYGESDIDYTDLALFRFDPESGETEKMIDRAVLPRVFGNDILYDIYETVIDKENGENIEVTLKSLSGSISLNYHDFHRPSDSDFRSGIMICGDQIFGTVSVVPGDWNTDKQLINVLTGEIILQTGNANVTRAISDNIIRINTFEEDDMMLLYFINENKLVPISKGDAVYDGFFKMTYDGFGLIEWSLEITRGGKLYTFSMK